MQVGVLYNSQYARYAKPQQAVRKHNQLQSGDKLQLIMLEIGFDHITTATSFVAYMREKYGFSKSSLWYNLKKLKGEGMLDFAEKGDVPKPLSLTKKGESLLRHTVSKNASSASSAMFERLEYNVQ